MSEEAKAEDLDARSTAIELALEAQRKADSLGRGKLSNLKKAKAKEAERRKKVEAFEKSKVPPRSEISAVARANQPTPKLPITRRSNRPGMDLME